MFIPAGRLVYRTPDGIDHTAGDRVIMNFRLRRATLCPLVDGEGPSRIMNANRNNAANTWVVVGRVVDADGAGLPGLRVSVFDKDLIFDDRLGTAVTDRDGRFEVRYSAEDFRELLDANPDLYVDVRDRDGSLLYSSRRSVRFEAGRKESFDIEIRRIK